MGHFIRVAVDGQEVGRGRVSGIDHRLNIVADHRTNGTFHVTVFAGEIDKPARIAQWDTGVGSDAIVFAVTFACRAVVRH